jgi:hypothetical protein
VKEFLYERGVAFELKDLNVDARARDEFRRARYPLPPVTVVDGVAVVGYDPVRLEELLRLKFDAT